ncbi:general transcription and DNA repair factor IIH helicase subunit XPB2-like [Zingiber officinale]|uniref:general transcription and DNA repair factor IIH helicase subunit XPB2-like n=1 Tax=Zingiber officinale TaxID=94328 RepID=UPI001C4AB712|nr:general transcription and DNA repair factor IIH helicase subunit XPB2-like [Zingiber officinale]
MTWWLWSRRVELAALLHDMVTLVLKMNQYYAESKSPKVLETLLEEEVISKAQIKLKDSQNVLQCFKDEYGNDVHSFEIDPSQCCFLLQVENVKHCLLNKLNYPMLEEYNFSMNFVNPELTIQMKPQARQRSYQAECESNIFINGRARSGLIVLPFHAGKSFVGVSTACKIRKCCLCLVSNVASVDQWASQFRLWSNIEGEKISLIKSDTKQIFRGLAGVVITTYEMLATFGGETTYKDYEKTIGEVLNKEWGLLLLDEVDDVPEQVFHKVISITKSHCKLGLTATLVRKDEKIMDLKFLIGPKLYEANKLDLVKEGFIPDVLCFEVQCPMTKEFSSEYFKTENLKRKQALSVLNPNKLRSCEFLIRAHEQEGHKIIIFGDNLFALTAYANKLQKPMICGATSHDKKTSILEDFKSDFVYNTIFLSKVGYNSIDILEANVIIQISSHTGLPHQEARRLGHILRAVEIELPKEKDDPSFYSLVSMETQEVADSIARQQFFVDQGYTVEEINILFFYRFKHWPKL